MVAQHAEEARASAAAGRRRCRAEVADALPEVAAVIHMVRTALRREFVDEIAKVKSEHDLHRAALLAEIEKLQRGIGGDRGLPEVMIADVPGGAVWMTPTTNSAAALALSSVAASRVAASAGASAASWPSLQGGAIARAACQHAETLSPASPRT